ncbi:MAG: hypothetical protein RJA68_138, partial [Actinomycetota bacterium]
ALAGSAGTYPHGLIDPIDQLSDLALERGINLHVDGCLGGFILAWGQDLGWGDYSGVTIDGNGVFHGSVINVNLHSPSLTFDCTECSVITDWRPVSVRNGGGGGSSGSPVVVSAPAPVATKLIKDLKP